MSSDQEQFIVSLVKDEAVKDIIHSVDEFLKSKGDNRNLALDFIIGALMSRYTDVAHAIANFEVMKFTLIQHSQIAMTPALFSAIRGPRTVKPT